MRRNFNQAHHVIIQTGVVSNITLCIDGRAIDTAILVDDRREKLFRRFAGARTSLLKRARNALGLKLCKFQRQFLALFGHEQQPLAAVALAVVRVEMGHLTVLSPRERGAISQVERGHLQPGVTYGQALVLVLARMGASEGSPTWYVQDRPWEHRVYVDWQLGSDVLSWGVSYRGQVTPSPETALILKEFERAGPAPQSPALPGL